MTEAQKALKALREKQSKSRQRMAELAVAESLTDETRAELDELEKGVPDTERQLRAAQATVDAEEAEARAKGAETGAAPDAEMRERIELRSKASLGRFLDAAGRGKPLQGAEGELRDAVKLPADAPDGAIPMELWDTPPERREVTAAPTANTGVNLDPLRPMVFAPSLINKLMVDMPMVPSGTYATGTISTAATADAVAKGADVPETAAQWTTEMTKAKRVGASLNLAAEDIANVGASNFESILRQHISLALSDELDDQMLNGDGQNDDLTGFFQRLGDPTSAPGAIANFDAFIAAFAAGIDGLWATEMSEVAIVAGVDTYRLSTRTFRDSAGANPNDLGDKTFADYAKQHTAGWWTNRRMPAAATFMATDNVQQAILCRKGRSMMPTPMRLAVCPSWGYLSIDDIYTGARKGERRYVISALVGDVILTQPSAFAQVAFQVA